jgi:hypothetical protein
VSLPIAREPGESPGLDSDAIPAAPVVAFFLTKRMAGLSAAPLFDLHFSLV